MTWQRVMIRAAQRKQQRKSWTLFLFPQSCRLCRPYKNIPMAAATTDNYRLMGGESSSDDMFALDWGGDAGACWEIW